MQFLHLIVRSCDKETGVKTSTMVVAIPRIEKWRIVSVGKDAEGGPSSLVVDLQSSSQLSADELLERFRRYRGNGLFASSHCAPSASSRSLTLLSLSLSLSFVSSRQIWQTLYKPERATPVFTRLRGARNKELLFVCPRGWRRILQFTN